MNTKILVNFEAKKIVHLNKHAGTREYQHLTERGYVLVGVIKNKATDPDPKIYWREEFFDPAAKYVKPNSSP